MTTPISQERMFKILLWGGSAAIFAELFMIASAFFAAFINPNLVLAISHTGSTFEYYQNQIEVVQASSASFFLILFLFSAVPALAMLGVIWTWHFYLAYEGVQFLHWIATSLALMGITIIFLFTGVGIGVLPVIAEAVENNEISYGTAFPMVALSVALIDVGNALLFGVYPLVLFWASWQKRLLPMWFLGIGLLFAVMTDLNLLLGRHGGGVGDLADFATILWPFLMGSILLQKSLKLRRPPILSSPLPVATPSTPPSEPPTQRG